MSPYLIAVIIVAAAFIALHLLLLPYFITSASVIALPSFSSSYLIAVTAAAAVAVASLLSLLPIIMPSLLAVFYNFLEEFVSSVGSLIHCIN